MNTIIAYKAVVHVIYLFPHVINSHVIAGTNPCINQTIHMLLIRGFFTLHIRILGRHKNDIIKSNV